jgi:hypothetical protein
MATFLATLVLGFGLGGADAAGQSIATISLYNSTLWQGPALVEVPTGRVAAPGLIDWAKVRLVSDSGEVPFAIREGRAHWQARITRPDTPRAEDLLVFWSSVPRGQWSTIHIASGTPQAGSAVERADGVLRVRYEKIDCVFDEEFGLLTAATAHGQPLLAAPMTATLWNIGEDGYRFSGPVGPGYIPQTVSYEKAGAVPMRARLAALSSTPAMTELYFVLEADGGPAMAVTYRVHAAGLLEVCADERPREGVSTWLDHALAISLALKGEPKVLPLLENRSPFYGFKDYAAVVRQTANHYDLDTLAVVELGEETVNGRSWSRRIYAFVSEGGEPAADLVELVDEGLVVDVQPVCSPAPTGPIAIESPEEAAVSARRLERVFAEAGLSAGTSPGTRVRLTLLEVSDAGAIEGDGFEIRPDASEGITIRSRTVLGLWQAVRSIAAHQRMHGLDTGIPFVARNPVVPIRAGGFGGGTFEVDFPYGTEEEWERTFDALLDSGMNVFWCLGMWGNWKLPVSYQYMPEIRSDSPDAYDESSGARFSELEQHRERGLKLMKYLQDRGAKVCVWLPIGCVPTTFAAQYPEAMSTVGEFRIPGMTPCFTHPTYRAYIDAFLRELIETYPLDGVVMVRDDNGGVCKCDRCVAYVAESRTKDTVWEQYLMIYDWLREHGYGGMIGVYPYFDGYAPAALESHLPGDLFVGGHGASTAILTRPHERIGHMGDTWLDNLYANFRLPPSPRMRRLLSDRCSFWIGGAYCGTELPWEAIGYFGWEPTATPNTFRYEWGARTFGNENALAFVAVSHAYERLWEINARYMLPLSWMQLAEKQRQEVMEETVALLSIYTERLDTLKQAVGEDRDESWFAHMGLFPVFLEYHLRRLGRFSEIYALVQTHAKEIDEGNELEAPIRDAILAKYGEIYAWAHEYGQVLNGVPGAMLADCRNKTLPYKEWMAGYDAWLDPHLERPQFAGTMTVMPVEIRAGQPFTLHVELWNTGICPWVAEAGQRLELSGATEQLGLPASWTFEGDPMAPGDRRTLEFVGQAPSDPGSADITLTLLNPYRVPAPCAVTTAKITWK